MLRAKRDGFEDEQIECAGQELDGRHGEALSPRLARRER
jgi:hypothetical protein